MFFHYCSLCSKALTLARTLPHSQNLLLASFRARSGSRRGAPGARLRGKQACSHHGTGSSRPGAVTELAGLCPFASAAPAARPVSEGVPAEAAHATSLCLRSAHPPGTWLLAQEGTSSALPSTETMKPARAFNFSDSRLCHVWA